MQWSQATYVVPRKHRDRSLYTYEHMYASGLPDFSWFKIPKREKCTKLPRTVPNIHKI
jgi:hypothetical protein